MAVKIAGVGLKMTVTDGTTVTPSRPFNGNGQTAFATNHWALNLSKGTSKQLTGVTRGSDRNKITSFTVADTTGWDTDDFYALLTDNGTVTFLTTKTAITAAGVNDTIIQYPFDVGGTRSEIGGQNFSVAGLIVESDTIGIKSEVHSDAGSTVTISATCTIRDQFHHGGFLRSFLGTHTSGTAVVDRFIVIGGRSNGIAVFQSGNGGTLNVRNGIIVGSGSVQFFTSSGAILNIRNVKILYGNGTGFNESSGTQNIANCISMNHRLGDYSSISGTQSNNISSDATASGAGSLINKTIDDLNMAITDLLNSPTDFRSIPTGTILDGAGIHDPSNLYDVSGYPHSNPPNIGESANGFTGFTATVVVPDAPVIAFVNKTATTIGISITGSAGKTHEIFTWAPGDTVGTSRGTLIGDGTFGITGLMEGVAYRITASTQV